MSQQHNEGEGIVACFHCAIVVSIIKYAEISWTCFPRKEVKVHDKLYTL